MLRDINTYLLLDVELRVELVKLSEMVLELDWDWVEL